MAFRINILPKPLNKPGGSLIVSARVDGSRGGRNALWFQVDKSHGSWLTWPADPEALAVILNAMRSGADLVVYGAEVRNNSHGSRILLSLHWNPHGRRRRFPVNRVRRFLSVEAPQRILACLRGRQGWLCPFGQGNCHKLLWVKRDHLEKNVPPTERGAESIRISLLKRLRSGPWKGLKKMPKDLFRLRALWYINRVTQWAPGERKTRYTMKIAQSETYGRSEGARSRSVGSQS